MMRSRPELELYLLPKNPRAGGRMRADAVLVSSSVTPIEGVEFHLEGLERRHSGTSMIGSVPVAKYATAVHVNLFGRTPATTLAEGKRTFAMTFDLPATAPPSYRSQYTTVEYTLSVRVVIPWWPDRVGRYVVKLGPLPRHETSGAASYCSDSRGPHGNDLFIEASIDRSTIAPGEVVAGAASFGNVSHHRIERIDLSFVAMERVAGAQDGGDEVERYTTIIHEGPPADSKPIPFRVRFPEKAVPSFRGALAELRWRAEIRAVISFGSDISLSIPLDVLCRPEGTAVPLVPSRVAPVGRERRAMVWAAVAQRHGFTNDPEQERMSRNLGDGALEITLEPRTEGGLATVARLRFPKLGIGLTVNEKRWTDVIRSKVETGHAAFDERFTTRGREEAQVRALLGPECCDALLGFERVSMDDGGAVLQVECAAQSAAELEPVVGRALHAAELLLGGTQQVPAPAAMSECVTEWAEFATLVNGRRQVGCMAVREAMFDGYPFELETEWNDDLAPARTVARLFLPDTTETDPEQLHGPAVEIAAAISKGVESLEVTREHVEAAVAAPLIDPRAILPTLEGLARLARTIEGKTSRGPYR